MATNEQLRWDLAQRDRDLSRDQSRLAASRNMGDVLADALQYRAGQSAPAPAPVEDYSQPTNDLLAQALQYRAGGTPPVLTAPAQQQVAPQQDVRDMGYTDGLMSETNALLQHLLRPEEAQVRGVPPLLSGTLGVPGYALGGEGSTLPLQQATWPGSEGTSLPLQQATWPEEGGQSSGSSLGLGTRAYQAPTQVPRNDTADYEDPNNRLGEIYMQGSGMYNIPTDSLGAYEGYAARRGMTGSQLRQQEDLLRARGIQESNIWQEQYARSLRETGDPRIARAHANLYATQASGNAYGVFDNAMADQTIAASREGQDNINARLYYDANAGSANTGLLSTVPQAYGQSANGGTLVRTPDGSVVSVNLDEGTPALMSGINNGATAAYQQDYNDARGLNALGLQQMQMQSAQNKGSQADPLYQLKMQKAALELQKVMQGGDSDLPLKYLIQYAANLPPEAQQLIGQQVLTQLQGGGKVDAPQ